MAEPELVALFDRLPEVIQMMPDEFSSHELILCLAKEYQPQYVEALYLYRHNEREGKPVPFMIVHGAIAQHLLELPDIVTKTGETPSTDIFGQADQCAVWRKV